jgi:hypothetical protein
MKYVYLMYLLMYACETVYRMHWVYSERGNSVEVIHQNWKIKLQNLRFALLDMFVH